MPWSSGLKTATAGTGVPSPARAIEQPSEVRAGTNPGPDTDEVALMHESAAILLAVTLLPSAAPPVLPTGGFIEQVRLHFNSWDADRDGLLSAGRDRTGVRRPQGERGCGGSGGCPPPSRAGQPKGRAIEPQADHRGGRADANPRLPRLGTMYAAHKERIRAARRELFVFRPPQARGRPPGQARRLLPAGEPGERGRQRPHRLKKAFKALPGGKVEVTFPTRRLVLDMPTDGEVCIGAHNGNDGMWALVYEKAVGAVLLERQKTRRHVTPLSVIGVGGTPNVPLELLTGHAVKRTGCEDFQRGKLGAHERERRLAEVRARLAEAVRKGRLIVGGTAPLGVRRLSCLACTTTTPTASSGSTRRPMR